MIIKKVSTTQFAGLKNRELKLNDGLNLVVENNEKGKSTIVNMISRTFFQEPDVKKKEFNDFREQYFPHKTGMPDSNNANGTVVVSTPEIDSATPAGDYKLYKKWSAKNPDISLETPKTSFDDPVTVNNIMHGILGYGEGVYTELLLSPQDAAAENLQKLLGAPGLKKNERYTLDKDTKGAINSPIVNRNAGNGGEAEDSGNNGDIIANAAKEAFSVGSAIPYETFETTVRDRIDTLIGNANYWDDVNNCPKATYGKRPGTGIKNSVLEASYKLEDAKTDYDNYGKLKDMVETAERLHKTATARCEDAVNEKDRFKKFAKQLEATNAVTNLNNNLIDYKTAGGVWKRYTENLATANGLSEALKAHKLLESFNTIDKLRIESEAKSSKLDTMINPENSKIQEAADAEEEIKTLAGQKRGLKVALNLTLHGDYKATLKTTDGRELDINAPITEAAIIEIPGVMTLEMAPEGIDPHDIDAKISALRNRVDAILGEFGVTSVKDLRELKAVYDEAARDAGTAANAFKNALGGQDYNTLAANAKGLTGLRDKAEIENEIRELCDGDADGYIATLTANIKALEINYKTPEALEELITNTEKKLEEQKRLITPGEEIPKEYRGIADPQAHLDGLDAKKTALEQDRDKCFVDLTNARNALNDFIKAHPEDLAEKISEWQHTYDERLAELNNWRHILEVFLRLKEEEAVSPFDTLTKTFKENLAKITDSGVSAELKEKDKLDLSLTSADNDVNYALLSDGTKEAVYLAFRLAVLDHLFPNGGGIIVFDDPLNNTDDERMERSCELIKEYAQRHQVIFLTCSDRYTAPLGVRPENIRHIAEFTPNN